MTSHLGEELRKENAKVAESMKILEGIANGAVNSVGTFTASPLIPPDLEEGAAALGRRIDEIVSAVTAW